MIKDKIIRDIRTLFKQEEDYYKAKRISIFCNNNFIEYKSNGVENSNLSLDKYSHEIKPFLKDIISLQNSDAWKIQLAATINLIFSKNTEEERVMYSTRDDIKFTSCNDVNDVLNEFF